MIINKVNDYNGWTNYATWRINLEILGDIQWVEEEIEILSPEMLEEYVENAVFENNGITGHLGLMEDYARAFLANVNYREILESIKDDYELNKD
ncbi:MAG TPA: hypothetical protein EYQ51_07645 [Alphaproteobacteria bacterium]|jgi:hypothetical protein|nr:hypothetical protein [Alphaproteobacteria bacterium]